MTPLDAPEWVIAVLWDRQKLDMSDPDLGPALDWVRGVASSDPELTIEALKICQRVTSHMLRRHIKALAPNAIIGLRWDDDGCLNVGRSSTRTHWRDLLRDLDNGEGPALRSVVSDVRCNHIVETIVRCLDLPLDVMP